MANGQQIAANMFKALDELYEDTPITQPFDGIGYLMADFDLSRDEAELTFLVWKEQN